MRKLRLSGAHVAGVSRRNRHTVATVRNELAALTLRSLRETSDVTMRTANRSRCPLSLALLAAPFALACGSSDGTILPAPAPGEGSAPAVMLSVISSNPDGRLTYVGAFPDVPSGEVGVDSMLEFGDAYYYAFDGSIFVWEREQAAITRYEVGDDMSLARGNTISFVSYGFKFGAELTFVSPTRAYMNVSEQDLVIVWDPSTMEVTGTFPANLPTPEGLDTFPVQIGRSGDNVYWAVISTNYDAVEVYPKNVLAIAPADEDGPVTIVEDDRCVPALGGYITGNGDIYLVGGADADAIRAYNPAAAYPPTCVVRVKANATEFDPDFFIDLTQATGSPALPGTWRIDDQYVLARVWDPEDPMPETIDEYWSGTSFVSKRIDIQTGEVSDFPAPPKGGFSSNIQDRIDGATYFSLPSAEGDADVAYRLGVSGIDEVFTIPGAGYWGMQRVR
jgi:uncharacterized protein DUF4374